ncbi:MAG: transglutaminase-like domain-containing protein [Clostridia bacterium]|nr:transglutaminase-like domain-containing protein [Clostridia bacterium]
MNLGKIFYNYIVNTMLASLLSLSLTYALVSSLNFPYKPYWIFLFIFALTTILNMVFINKLTVRISYVLLSVGFLSGCIYIYVNHLLQKVPGFLYSFVLWNIRYINWETPLNRNYSAILLGIILFAVTFFIFIFTCRRFNFIVILITGLCIFVPQWIFDVFTSYKAFYLFIFAICIYYLKQVYLNNSQNGTTDYLASSSFILWTAPFCALVVTLALMFPAKPNPIEWKWLDTKINQTYNYFNHKLNSVSAGDYFSLATSGFGGGTDLGGKVNLDKTKVLKVEAPRPVYLKAVAKDMYTGTAWLNTKEEKTPIESDSNKAKDDIKETLSRVYGLEFFNKKKFDDCFYTDKVKVTFLDIKTKSLFVTSKSQKFDLSNLKANTYVDSTGSLFVDKKLGKDISYSFETYTPKYSDQNLIELLKNSNRGFYSKRYEDRIQYFNDMFPNPVIERNADGLTYKINHDQVAPTDNLSLTFLKSTFANLSEVNSRYLQLPQNLPSRISDLAKSITAKANTDYDKVKAIEEYLSKNFPYTLATKATPKNRDFVDYFLFDIKQGYCTYYASSMAVMVRSIGIPARYVEGYVVPSRTQSANTYEVTNEQAHAWVEVYFEGFGWLPFEPTSPFQSTFYSNNEYQGIYDPSMNMDPYYLEYMNRMKGLSDSEFDPSLLEGLEAQEENRQLKYILIGIAIVSAIILTLLSIILFNKLRVHFMLKKLDKLPANESILAYYTYFLKLLSYNDLNFEPGETPIEFAARADKFILFKSTKFKVITEIFLKARYSTITASDKEKAMVADFYVGLITITKMHLSKHKFFILRYLIGRI